MPLPVRSKDVLRTLFMRLRVFENARGSPLYLLPIVLVLVACTVTAFAWYPSRRSIAHLRSALESGSRELKISYASLQAALKAEDSRRSMLEWVSSKESRLPDTPRVVVADWYAICGRTGAVAVSASTGPYEPSGPAYLKAPFEGSARGTSGILMRTLETALREIPGLSIAEMELSLAQGTSGNFAVYILTVRGHVFAKGSSDGFPR